MLWARPRPSANFCGLAVFLCPSNAPCSIHHSRRLLGAPTHHSRSHPLDRATSTASEQRAARVWRKGRRLRGKNRKAGVVPSRRHPPSPSPLHVLAPADTLLLLFLFRRVLVSFARAQQHVFELFTSPNLWPRQGRSSRGNESRAHTRSSHTAPAP